jgi:hypothetical protein
MSEWEEVQRREIEALEWYDWAIDELYSRHVPAYVQSYGEVERELISLVQDEPEDSDGHKAAQIVLQTIGGVSRLANKLGVNDVH